MAMTLAPTTLPGRSQRALGRKSRLLFHWHARNLSLTPVTGELPTFVRAGQGGLLRGSNALLRTSVHSQARFEWFDLDGDGVFETAALFIGEARTNVNLESQAFSDAAWTSVLTPVLTENDTIAPDGEVTADKIEDNNAAGNEGRRQDVTIANDSTTWCDSVYIKKGLAGAAVIALQLELIGGTTTRDATLFVDPILGTSIATSDVVQSDVIDEGAYWRVWVSVANNTTGNVTKRTTVYPAARPPGDIAAATFVVSAQGSAHFWQSQGENDEFPSIPVKTTAASVALLTDDLIYPFLWTPGVDKSVYGKVARPIWADFAPATVKPFFNLGTVGNSNLRVQFDAATTMSVELRDDVAALASASRNTPAGAAIEFCAQIADLDVAGKVRLDVGAGFSGFSGTVGKASAWANTTLEVGAVGTNILNAGLIELKFADGLFTLPDMQEKL